MEKIEIVIGKSPGQIKKYNNYFISTYDVIHMVTLSHLWNHTSK